LLSRQLSAAASAVWALDVSDCTDHQRRGSLASLAPSSLIHFRSVCFSSRLEAYDVLVTTVTVVSRRHRHAASCQFPDLTLTLKPKLDSAEGADVGDCSFRRGGRGCRPNVQIRPPGILQYIYPPQMCPFQWWGFGFPCNTWFYNGPHKSTH